MKAKAQLQELLKKHGYSLTRPRLGIFEALQETKEPMTVVDLASRLLGIDKVSVYRTIDIFEKTGVVHRVWTGFKSKIELAEVFSPHHHHFTCLKCGRTIPLESKELERDLKSIETANGFILLQHSVELSGYCSDCAKNAAK